MKIYNEKFAGTAKVAILKSHIKGLSDLSDYGKKLKAAEINPQEVIYISLFDKPVKGSIPVSDMRLVASDLFEMLKQLNINILVDEVGYIDSKGKYQFNQLMAKVFHKDVSLWRHNGIFVGKLNDFSIKMVAGFRPTAIIREMMLPKVIDSEFLIDLGNVNIERVTSTERAKEVFKDLYKNNDEIFYDTETSGLRWEKKGAKVLTLQLTGGVDKNTSYVFFYGHSAVAPEDGFIEVIQKGMKWILESGKKIFIHNANFDILWTKKHICPDLDFYKVNIVDTMILYHFLTNSTETIALGLKESSFINKIAPDWETDLEVARTELCRELKLKKEEFSYELFDIDLLERYAGIDTIVLAYYWDMLKEKNENHIARPEVDFIETTWFKNWQPIMQSIHWSIWYGLPFDIDLAKSQLADMQKQIDGWYADILNNESVAKAVDILNNIAMDKAMVKYQAKVEAALAKGKEFKGAAPSKEKGKYDSVELDVEFNPSSLVHKRVLFFDVLGLTPLTKTESGAAGVGSDDISTWAEKNPEINILSLFNKIATAEKEMGTYLKPFIELSETSFDGYIRGSFVPLNKSLRMRSTSPNLLNLPKTDFKYCFRKKGNVTIQLDYSALENILSLNHTRDEARLAQYKAGIEDAHSVNAIIAGKALGKKEYADLEVTKVDDVKFVKGNYPMDRQNAKAITFALQYLGSHRSIQFGLGIPEEDAITIYNNYWETYKGERQFFKDCVKDMNEKGYIKFFGDGVILTPDIENKPESEEVLKQVRTPFNTTSQSGAFLTLQAMDKSMRKFHAEGKFIHTFLSVYDSIIYSCPIEDAIYSRGVFIDNMTVPYEDNQAVLLKADAEIGVSYKAEEEFEGTESELQVILDKYVSRV